jgi:SAM-dependent methyltransferase
VVEITEQDPLRGVLERLANRGKLRTEANIQSDIRMLLLSGGLGLAEHDLDVDLETPVPGGRRIDIEVGYTVIEVKKDIRSTTVIKNAVKQLAGYVASRAEATGQRYVGILTDGVDWRAYELESEDLIEATRFEFKSVAAQDMLLSWLGDVLATKKGIPPTPGEIESKLGASSPSYALHKAALTALYDKHRDLPTVQVKRQLWGRLLRSALGTQFTDTDELFIEHTLLVNSAEIIAHLVLGFDVTDIKPSTLLKGHRFALAQVYGVVDDDFFDWDIEVPGGDSFIRTVARHLTRFNWTNVEHDVLKVLYESVIGAATRRRLGEYYTPDWLADQVVRKAITHPLTQRVVDPACGSGTFLFHAVRRYLDAADKQDIPLKTALTELPNHVLGIDLHPVGVALARVTYLLAIGRERLTDNSRGPITVPVYLGDSVQWAQRDDLLGGESLLISTGIGEHLFEDELRFPDNLLDDAGWFDRLIDQLATLATKPRKKGDVPPLTALYTKLSVPEKDQPTIAASFEVLCKLQDQERNHIWSYYIRNLARPAWLSRTENRVDALIGNPPWLSYRNMPPDMQEKFRELSGTMGLLKGKTVAPAQDLSGLFVARATQQYLKVGGTFAFVMPNAVLDRGYFKGFRAGKYKNPDDLTYVEFTGSWDLRRLRPHFFPRGSAVVFGTRRTRDNEQTLPTETERWTGKLPRTASSWEQAGPHIRREPAQLRITDDDALAISPYDARFAEGATITPRVLYFVESQPKPASPLGTAGRRAVQSLRSSTEKPPWKHLDPMKGVVESEFVRPVLLGESLLPYRVMPAREAVLPLYGDELMDTSDPRLDEFEGLAKWWTDAEEIWNTYRSSERFTLRQRLDFRRGMTDQVPASPLRVAYPKAGMHVCAALVTTPNAIMDHKVIWGTVNTEAEGLYLCAILNCPDLTRLVRPLMSYGKDERDIDKHPWELPIPLYNPEDATHQRLTEIAKLQAEAIATLDLDEGGNFITLRQHVRDVLNSHPTAEELSDLVTVMLG